MSSPFEEPSSLQDQDTFGHPHGSHNPYYQQRKLDQPHQSPALGTEAEIEMLRQRIDYLQTMQPPEYTQMAIQSGRSDSTSSLSQDRALYDNEPPEIHRAIANPGLLAYAPKTGTSDLDSRSFQDVSHRPNMQYNSSPASAARPPAFMQPQILSKIIAIPATGPKLGSPFLRAYPPSLGNYNLPSESFLHFVDNLNHVAAANPPLQVLGLAGTITGFVPGITTQLVGVSLSLASKVGSVAVSKGRTELYLREANKNIFGPRGLRVEIAKLEGVAALAGIPTANDFGDGNFQLLDRADPHEFHQLSDQERCLRAVEHYVAPLKIMPLPMSEQNSSSFSKLSRAAGDFQRKRADAKLVGDRRKAEDNRNEQMNKLDREEAELRQREHGNRLERGLEKIERERQKAGRRHGRGSDHASPGEMEQEAFKKILWLVVRNLEGEMVNGPSM